MKFYKFTFADGTMVFTAKLSTAERKAEERKHGKLISKEAI